MNKKDLAERYLKNINKNVHLNFTLSYRPLQMQPFQARLLRRPRRWHVLLSGEKPTQQDQQEERWKEQ